jgi:hypothetical protein
MNLLTAIVPIHKMSGRLEDLKQWVCESVKLDIHVVLVHDFGDTETEQELQDFVKRQNSPHITFISGNYGGPGLARNAAMHLIRTEYFCFWDSDDFPLVQSFHSMVTHAAENKVEIAVGGYNTETEKPLGREKFVGTTQELINQVALNPGLWRMAFRSQRFNGERFRNLRLAEDQLFLVDLDFAEQRLSPFPGVVYQYNQESPNSLTKQLVNLIDVPASLMVIREKLTSVTSILSRNFLLALWLRQSLTLLKLGSFSLKKVSLRNLVAILVESSLQEKLFLIKFFTGWRRR